jgi:hypothetical protein
VVAVPAAGAGAAAEGGAGEAAAVVVEGAGAPLSVLQAAGNIAKIEQTKSFFGAIMTYSSSPNRHRSAFDSSGNVPYIVARAALEKNRPTLERQPGDTRLIEPRGVKRIVPL